MTFSIHFHESFLFHVLQALWNHVIIILCYCSNINSKTLIKHCILSPFISYKIEYNYSKRCVPKCSALFLSDLFFSASVCVCVCLCKHGCGGFYLNGYDLKWVVFATDLCDNKYTKYIYYRRAYMDRDKKMRLHALQIHTNCIR